MKMASKLDNEIHYVLFLDLHNLVTLLKQLMLQENKFYSESFAKQQFIELCLALHVLQLLSEEVCRVPATVCPPEGVPGPHEPEMTQRAADGTDLVQRNQPIHTLENKNCDNELRLS